MYLEFMLEVGCEEIPARYIDPTLVQLQEQFQEILSGQLIEHSAIEVFATPRRLVVSISQLSARQPDRVVTLTGPPLAAAFDDQNQPTRAAQGFAAKYQLTVDELKFVETEKGKYLGFERQVPGRTAQDILVEGIPTILSSIEFPKNMIWEESHFLFARPIRWLLCLFGGEVIPIRVAGITASNKTFGHRILSGNTEIQVNNFQEYTSSLIKFKVQFDPKRRLEKIRDDLRQKADQLGGELIPDQQLLHTVVYLNEFPSVICGGFDSAFLSLPSEVLVTVMREHQKYFSLRSKAGSLLPKFLAVVDSDELNHERIKAGHERVLKARLADAVFFWDMDQKVLLEDRLPKLNRIIFQAKLGTVFEKTSRLITLSEYLAKSLKNPELLPDLHLAAKLSKVDLTTEMVKEFTNLQGIMGGLYARAQGLPETVAGAISDHYRPTSLEEESPRSLAGAVLSIADKLDSVMGAFSIGLVPTGSKDPLAIRRQTMGIIKVLLDKKISISILKNCTKAFAGLKEYATRNFDETYQDFRSFLRERLRYVFKELGYSYDEINAIIEIGDDNPLICFETLKAIATMRNSDDFHSIAQSFKRVKNIILKAGLRLDAKFEVVPELFELVEEEGLYRAVRAVGPKVKRACRAGDYLGAFSMMAALRPQVDSFFEKVLVMSENPTVQKNRLSLLGSLSRIFLGLADVSEIVVSSN